MTPHAEPARRLGVLLINLGTPDSPEPASIRRYLREFLSDPRVIEVPRPIWWLILNLFILPFRPKRLAEKYRQIWSPDGAPIRAITQRQANKLEALLAQAAPDSSYRVLPAMTYGNPSIASALDALHADGIQDVTLLPLYPQFSATTTAAVVDVLAKAVRARRDLPGLRVIRSYATHSAYIEALAISVEAHWANTGERRHLVMSFHGIPQPYADKGDPYPQECVATANALAARLKLAAADWTHSFQSRFGAQEWLKPYTDKTMAALPTQGITAIDVICPGFSADCLETLEEIDEENREIFLHAGGKHFNYIPALNDSEAHIQMMMALVRQG